MLETKLTVTDASLIPAFDEWAKLASARGKDVNSSLRKVMRFWVSFALAKIPPGDPQKIRAQLMAITVAYSRIPTKKKKKRSRVSDEMRGTLAVALVQALNWQGARALKGAKLYTKARSFVNKSAATANFHKAGLRVAMAKLRVSSSGLPRLKAPPGTYDETLTTSATKILVENFAHGASKQSTGILGIAPQAFETALPEVSAMVARFLLEDTAAAGRKAGFSNAA